ncbi:MAG: hypothetical protein JWN62_4732 [Acidimicrobiales bacterium]|nr:hypothetical protein [Acidimicrobiales bacterium]
MPLLHLDNWAMFGLDVAAWGAIHAGTGYIAHRLPMSLCERETWLTTIRSWERSGRIWQWARVHSWKDRVPEAGDLFAGGVSKRVLPGRDDAGLRSFAASTRRAEMGHWMAAVASPLFALWNPLWIAGVMVVYGMAVNAPFIAIQRYNRLRVLRLLSRRSSRRAAAALDRADRIGSNMPYGSPPSV